MSFQFTLEDLQQRVESLIELYGKDAPMAAWIYTSNDVVKYDDDGNEVLQSPEVCDQVLVNLQDYDNIYSTIVDAIESELAQVDSNNKVGCAS